MSRAGWKVHYIIREASGCNLVIQPVRDSAHVWFQRLIQSGEFDDCIELMELHTNDRGRVVQERVTHSYSKMVGHVIEHTARPRVFLEDEIQSTSLLNQ
jgi:hypothetical protein